MPTNIKPDFISERMLLLILWLLILLIQKSTANRDDLPVFVIDAENVTSHLKIQPNPFVKLTESSFADVVQSTKSECVIIFVEEKLCTEDISLKDKLGSPYRHLHQKILNKTAKYIPSVTEPYKVLSKIFPPQKPNVVFFSPGVKLPLEGSLKYFYLYFQDGRNQTRAQSLRKHDAIMQEVYATVRISKSGPIVGIYTGKVNPIAVKKLEFVAIKPKAAPRDIGVMVVSEGALFRFSGVYASSAVRRTMFNQQPLIGEETWTRRKLSTTMAYTEFEMQFNFSFEDDQWLLDNVALREGGEEVGRTEMGVGAPWNWSYVCGEPLMVINTRDGSTVIISQYQIQPIRPQTRRQEEGEGGEEGGDTGGEQSVPAEDTTKCFGKSVNCGPYFNTHILSGLFVTAIFLAIMTYGIVTLYNCGINDRFDDPNGKEVVTSSDYK